MTIRLILVTESASALSRKLTHEQGGDPDWASAETIDCREVEPDYQQLIRAIFDADQIAIW